MKKFENPEIKVVLFAETPDVITTSFDIDRNSYTNNNTTIVGSIEDFLGGL